MKRVSPGFRVTAAAALGLFLPWAAFAEFDGSHARYASVLSRHVSDGRVDYQGLKRDPGELDRYLEEVASVPEREFNGWVVPDRLAFLVNLHNATCLRMVRDRYPVGSFRRVAGWFKDPWQVPALDLFGSRLTLAILRDNMMRRHYAEPGIHLALNWGARGCPPLREEPYIGSRFYEQLADQGARFFARPEWNAVDIRSRTVTLSPIFRWYRGDFERRAGSVADYVRIYFSEEVRDLAARGRLRVEYGRFDWNLNERKPGP